MCTFGVIFILKYFIFIDAILNAILKFLNFWFLIEIELICVYSSYIFDTLQS